MSDRDDRPWHGPDDRRWLWRAIELSRLSEPGPRFRVGAVVVDGDGAEIATGYTGLHDPENHAEEVALAVIPPADPRLAGATVYSSLEPCRERASRPASCAELIVAAGIRRVVFAWCEPPLFVAGHGAELLADAGVEVVQLSDLADEVRQLNAHLLG